MLDKKVFWKDVDYEMLQLPKKLFSVKSVNRTYCPKKAGKAPPK